MGGFKKTIRTLILLIIHVCEFIADKLREKFNFPRPGEAVAEEKIIWAAPRANKTIPHKTVEPTQAKPLADVATAKPEKTKAQPVAEETTEAPASKEKTSTEPQHTDPTIVALKVMVSSGHFRGKFYSPLVDEEGRCLVSTSNRKADYQYVKTSQEIKDALLKGLSLCMVVPGDSAPKFISAKRVIAANPKFFD